MNQIVIFGVNHNDPCARFDIEKSLKELQAGSFVPKCIAVEWKKEYAERVIAQRQNFSKMLAAQFPATGLATLNRTEKIRSW